MQKETLLIVSLYFFLISCVNITSQDDACRDLFKAKHGGKSANQLCIEGLAVSTRAGTNAEGIGRDGSLYLCASYIKNWRDCRKESDILPTILGGVKP